MSKILVLAEKPSVGRDIARVLKCNKKGNGYIEGNEYIVTWALGHLVTLATPEVYNEKYKCWNIGDLPIIPSKINLEVIKKTAKQFNTVKQLMYRKEVNSIIIATDAGREGELVARWIIEKAKVKKPIKRLWISSVTDKAIKDGFKNLKPGKNYENIYESAKARAEADWIVGINATRSLTCKYNAQLSCGRVQTPTLAIIQKREEEIKKFKSQKYYGITALVKSFKLVWQDSKTHDIKTFNKEKCNSIINSINNKSLEIVDVKKSNKKTFSPRLYDLTELQRDANKIFNYSAKETLSIMQKLYEHHKVLTYPRTDSRYITTDIVDTLKDRIKACSIGSYSKLTSKILKSNIKPNKSFVDNSKVSDHHAIIPTEESPVLSSLNDKERKIYDLVVKRFLAVLSEPYEYEQVSIKGKIGNEIFIAKGSNVKKLGWKEIYTSNYEYEEDTLENQILPEIKKGDILKVNKIVLNEGNTKPPKPFNEATLLSAMENPCKYMNTDNKNLIKTLENTGGLGTVATRADIIEKLLNTFLIEKKGKDIFITSKGKQLLDLVPNELKSPKLTAKWEEQLGLISKGQIKRDNFIYDIKKYTNEIVTKIKNSKELFKHDNVTGNRCPECGKLMLEVNGKKGRMLICQDRECGYRENLARFTNVRCPQCHKKLELRGKSEGQIYICTNCNFREKLSSFKNRFKESSGKVNKREVSKYLKKMKEESKEPINSALADALSKLNLK